MMFGSRSPIELAFVFCHPSRGAGGPLRDLLATVFHDRFRAEYNTAPDAFRFADVSEASFMFDLVCRYQPRPILAVATNFLVVPAFIGPTIGVTPFGTVLRDPVERICSEFAWQQSAISRRFHCTYAQRESVRSALEFAQIYGRNNLYTRFFSQTETWEPISDAAISMAKRQLQRFALVARPDRDGLSGAARSMIALLPSGYRDAAAAWCHANQRRLDRMKKTRGRRVAKSLSPGDRSRLEQDNAADIDLLESRL